MSRRRVIVQWLCFFLLGVQGLYGEAPSENPPEAVITEETTLLSEENEAEAPKPEPELLAQDLPEAELLDRIPISTEFLADDAEETQKRPKLFQPNVMRRPVNGIAAIVNDEIITVGQLQRELGPLIYGIQKQAKSQQDFDQRVEALTQEILDNLIERRLLVAQFKEMGGKVPKSFIENDFEDFLSQKFNGDRHKLHEALKSQEKTILGLRNDIEEGIMMGAMRHHASFSQSEISPEKIENFYNNNRLFFFQEEQVKLRQITLRPSPEENEADLIARAEKLIDKLKSNTPFEEVARGYSQDELASSGGSYGWISYTDIHEELAKEAFLLEAGEFSESPVILNDHAFILLAEKKHDERIQPLEEAREFIEERLAADESKLAQKKWAERLRKNAYVKIMMD